MSASHSKLTPPSVEDPLCEFKKNCTHPALSEHPKILQLIGEGKLTTDDVNHWSSANAEYLVAFESTLQRVIDGDFSIELLKHMTFKQFGQLDITSQCIRFLKVCNEDVSWYVDKEGVKTLRADASCFPAEFKKVTEKLYSAQFIQTFKTKPGICNGLTVMWLACAFQEEMNRVKLESERKALALETDTLKKFYENILILINWDQDPKSLTADQKKIIGAMLYQIMQFQDAQFHFQHSLFLSNDVREQFSFVKQASYVLTVTKAQLKEKLALLIKKDHLIHVASTYHATGVFNQRFYNSNSPAGDCRYENLDELVNHIFRGTFCQTTHYPDSRIIIISLFRHSTSAPLLYPTTAEVIEDCADASVIDPVTGYNALYGSLNSDLVDSLKVYISKENCDVNLKDKHGTTPLSTAFYGKHTACIRALLKDVRCDVNLADEFGQTPLMFAAAQGMDEFTTILLETKKTEINRVDRNGQSALILAIGCGKLKSARILLQHGATGDLDSIPWGNFAAQKERNLKNPVVKGYIKSGFITLREAHALTEEDISRLENLLHFAIIKKGQLSVSQLLTATDEQLFLFQIIFKTLTALPETKDEKPDLRAVAIDDYLYSLLISLKSKLEIFCGEHKIQTENVRDAWLLSTFKILNGSIDKNDLSQISRQLKATLGTMQSTAMQNVIDEVYLLIKETLPTAKPFFSFRQNLKMDLKNIFESKTLLPAAKLNKIEFTLNKIVATEHSPAIYKKIVSALPYSPVAIFNLRTSKEFIETYENACLTL